MEPWTLRLAYSSWAWRFFSCWPLFPISRVICLPGPSSSTIAMLRSPIVHNLCGVVGAVAAGYLYFFFGAASYLWIIVLAGYGIAKLTTRNFSHPGAGWLELPVRPLRRLSGAVTAMVPERLEQGFPHRGAGRLAWQMGRRKGLWRPAWGGRGTRCPGNCLSDEPGLGHRLPSNPRSQERLGRHQAIFCRAGKAAHGWHGRERANGF